MILPKIPSLKSSLAIDRTLIISVFVVASCGLAYELITGALASYLLGDSILQFSTIIGTYLFAMGIGSHFSKYIKDEDVLQRFIEVELLVGLIGGLSATFLFVIFAWLSMPFRVVLYALVLIVGILVGMEIPLVMRILNQRKAEFSELVSKVLTFDYLGALAVSLLFPLILAPKLGLARSALLFGLCNAGIAGWTAWRFREELPNMRKLFNRTLFSIVILLAGFVASDRLVRWSEGVLFGDPVIYAKTTQYQRLVLTKWKDDLRLYINGNLQFSSRDEHRYHEALVHPILAALPQARRVLILGGGDGLALREVLRYPQIEHATLVDLDPAMTQLFSTNAELTALNKNSFHNPKVRVINDDAARWLEQNSEVFDAIIMDFPDPSNFGLGKLYSVPMYRLVARHLSEHGLVVVQSTSPYHAPRSFWCVAATLEKAGFYTTPYHALVPSFGEWGFIIGAKNPSYQPPTHYSLPMTFLDKETTAQMFHFPPDMKRWNVLPNELNNQQLVHYFQQDWGDVIR
ncbi:polyamine aminopropyltransferase [Aquirhabdus parva]|uniref:Polyamine aminopropyltransferase n=1 Tax=Aquirhabdus parva TaxID=2283318 RepID=A0A345P7E6_9GAMM|nr:polyamine aminopropyltransferase [Aquirhabdus parva]AXI03205.1 polyamine aminopropyltransferase [Aquirhabdus parva]